MKIINDPVVDDVFLTTQADWHTAMNEPFIFDNGTTPLVTVGSHSAEHELASPDLSDNDKTGNDNDRALGILMKIKSGLGELISILPNNRPEILSSLTTINHLCDFVASNFFNQPNLFPTASLPLPPSSPPSVQSPVKKTLKTILKRPERPERSKVHRKYGKIPKFGVMSSDEVVKQFEEDQNKKENLKENKIKRQKEIQALQQQIKMLRENQKAENIAIKQEKTEEPKKLKTARGRKRKATVLSELLITDSNEIEHYATKTQN